MVAYYLFASSITAMKSEAKAFEIIGHNIANSTTPGHKEERAEFRDLLVERPKGGVFPAFRGTTTHVRRDVRAEGVVTNTGNPFDVALSGRGFFIVNSELNGSGKSLLTDAGMFQTKLVQGPGGEEAYLADHAGNFVQGWPFNIETETFTIGNSLASLNSIRIDEGSQTFQAQATTSAVLNANLPADAAKNDFFELGFNVFDGSGSADGVRDGRNVTARFSKTAAVNTWSVQFFADNAVITAAQPSALSLPIAASVTSTDGVNTVINTGTITANVGAGGTSTSIDVSSLLPAGNTLVSATLSDLPPGTSIVSGGAEIPIVNGAATLNAGQIANASLTPPLLMTFGPDGSLTSSPTQQVGFAFTSPDASTTVSVDFSKMQSFEPGFVLRETSSNGFEEGFLASTFINDKGEVIGNFTNGRFRPVAKLAIGDVVNPELLAPVSDTHFQISALNGPLQLFEVDKTDRVTLVPNALEGSTVNLEREMTHIILTQRAYSSAATALRTIEELLGVATNMKR